MKIFRFLLIVIGFFIFLLFAIPIFLPNKAYSEREIEINAKVDSIYNFVMDLNNFQHWNPWTEMEKELVLTIDKNNNSTVKIAWDGDTLGTGYIERIDSKPNQLIKSKVVFLKPWESEALDIMKFQALDSTKTKVVWGMEMHLDYPFGRYFNFFYDKMIGTDYEKGLKKLKTLFESK